MPIFLGALGLALATSCGQSPSEEQASSAQGVVLPDVPVDDAPTRALSPELPGDHPAFRGAADAFDSDVLEKRAMAVTGLTSMHHGVGYFGQRLFVSVWTTVPDDVAMRVCHELVAYANEIDFPATRIQVTEKTYADLEWSKELVTVDATGSCVQVEA